MAIDKSIEPLFNQDDFEMGPEGLTVVEEMGAPDDSLVTEMDDGSVVVDFDPLADLLENQDEFSSNLAEFVEDSELNTLASDLVSKFELKLKNKVLASI